MTRIITRPRLAATGVAVAALLAAGGTPAALTTTASALVPAQAMEKLNPVQGDAGDEAFEARTASEQLAQARTAPGIVAPGAYSAAAGQIAALPVTGAAWSHVTDKPYNSDDTRYRDYFTSNSQGGSGLVSGRVTGLAVAKDGYVYAGGADGGVFRRSPSGTWTPIADALPTLSTGDLEIGPDGALWYATGEANTGGTSYVGTGVYRLASPQSGTFTPANRVGGTELESTTINKVRFDDTGRAFAATNRGIWSYTAGASAWQFRYAPNPDYLPVGVGNGTGTYVAGTSNAAYKNIVNDIAVQPGTGGRRMIASVAWRGGDTYNGFYESKDAGATWTKVNPTGAINPKEIGNAEFSYSRDGSTLYTVLESTVLYAKATGNVNTYLAGVYASRSGSVSGPWSLVADSTKLANSGSALKQATGGKGYGVGIQAWYNNFIQVDPTDPQHVYLGLEEVFETRDGGSSWKTVAPYWNFYFSCWDVDPAKNTCPSTTHSDQHAVAFSPDGKNVYVGNDGGVFTRPSRGATNKAGNATDWTSLNTGGALDTLQYYAAGVGRYDPNAVIPAPSVYAGKTYGQVTGRTTPGVAVSGGLQDNGGSLLLPGDTRMGSNFGGDGGDVLVDPANGCNIVQEYVYLSMSVTNVCGVSDGTIVQDRAARPIRDIDPGDPNPRFIAPFAADTKNKDHWVAGGEYVWTQDKGFAIQSGDDWTPVFDQGAGHSTTAIASQGGVTYAAWCGPCNNSGFARGLSTNYGGTWHQLSLPADGSALPNRYLAGVAVDPSDASGGTAYVAVNGFSRRFTEGPGAGVGHVFKTVDGGLHWSDLSAGLPDVPANSVVVSGGRLVVATDLAVFTRGAGDNGWSRLGTGLPLTVSMKLTTLDGVLYAATHGRGIWSVPLPS